MFKLLHTHVERRVHLSPKECALLDQYFTPKKIKRHQFLLQEGDFCKHIAFVNSGCLRAYTVDQRGEEHVIQFAIEDWWISDLNSFLTGSAATYNIDAVQDSEVLLLERTARDTLLDTVPQMERFFRLLQEANYISSHQRINDSLSASAEERYLAFIKTFPRLVEQIPQGQIASYLGITPQSLSRIRKELSHKR
jgi:CRP-like cAMP-binding protein